MTATGVASDAAAASLPAAPDPADLRADAQQNRKRILAAAHAAFTASSDASLNSIAKAAGVGPGTLYRHFPSREDLILAVYADEVRTLAASASDLLATHPPQRALRLWLERVADYGLTKHSLADALLHSATSSGLAAATYAPVLGAIRTMLTACEQEGTGRPGVRPDDVLLLLAFAWRIDQGPDAPQRAARLLDVVIAGLQAGAPGAVAGHAGRPSRTRSLRLLNRLSLRGGSRARSRLQ